MVEAGQDVTLLDRRSQPLEEPVLGAVMHDPVRARYQQLRRNADRARIGHNALARLIKREQNIDRDRPGNQRIGLEGGDALAIVGQEAGLDIGIDKEVAT